MDIIKSCVFLDIHYSILGYPKNELWIFNIQLIKGYPKIELWISKNRLSDIQKSNYGYPKIELLISINGE